MKMNEKFITTLIIIIGLSVIVGGIYFYNNNDAQTINENSAFNDPDDNKLNQESYYQKDVDTGGTGKSSYSSQEAQTASREMATGIFDNIDEYGIMFAFEPVYPHFPKYKLPINVSGYVSDKTKWGIFEGEAGSVSVYDENGKLLGMSPLTLRHFDYTKEPPFYFNVMVGDREWMSNLKTENGYVIVKEAGAKDGEVLSSIKVPIKFDLP